MKMGIKILAIAMIVMAGCKTAQKLPVSVPIMYREKIVEKLTPVALPVDNTNVLALFNCDEHNQVILKELNEEKTKRIQSQFSFNAGMLKYRAKTALDTVYLEGKDVYIDRDVPVYINVPGPVTNILTGWQWTQIYFGRLCLGIILVFGIYKGIRWRFKN